MLYLLRTLLRVGSDNMRKRGALNVVTILDYTTSRLILSSLSLIDKNSPSLASGNTGIKQCS